MPSTHKDSWPDYASSLYENKQVDTQCLRIQSDALDHILLLWYGLSSRQKIV